MQPRREGSSLRCEERPPRGPFAVVFAHGCDRPGIVAGLSSVLARVGANILDISQTVLRGVFSMAMIVDLSGSSVGLAELRRLLEEEARRLGVEVSVHSLDLVKAMERP